MVDHDEAQEADLADLSGHSAAVPLSGQATSTHELTGQVGLAVSTGVVKEDWEDEKHAEEALLQALVDRLDDKGEKEVARVLKVSSPVCDVSRCAEFAQTIEFDKRLSASFPKLEINRDTRDRVLALALEDEGFGETSKRSLRHNRPSILKMRYSSSSPNTAPWYQHGWR